MGNIYLILDGLKWKHVVVANVAGLDLFVCFFFCLFVVLRSTRQIFTHTDTSPFIFDLYSALMVVELLSSKGSLACHTYCDMGNPYNSYLYTHIGYVPTSIA